MLLDVSIVERRNVSLVGGGTRGRGCLGPLDTGVGLSTPCVASGAETILRDRVSSPPFHPFTLPPRCRFRLEGEDDPKKSEMENDRRGVGVFSVLLGELVGAGVLTGSARSCEREATGGVRVFWTSAGLHGASLGKPRLSAENLVRVGVSPVGATH